MSIGQTLLPEFDYEMGLTRKVLSRLPDQKFGWRPHEKSMTLGQLASHLAHIPTWGEMALDRTSFDVAPAGGPAPVNIPATTRAEALEKFDQGVARLRAMLAIASDEALFVPWSLLKAGEVVFTVPRIGVIRTLVLNHMIHHRAQLTLYYRLNGIAVPSIYGPSADEQ